MENEEIRYTGNAEEYLLQIPVFTKEKHSLDTVREIFHRIGRIPEGTVVHVAGTNGKGSVCAFLASALQECGFTVGLFTSPHLQDIRERIAFNGEKISQREFEHCFRLVLGDVRACMKDGISHPSFFEFLFYMAMVFFSEKKPDYIILETGMGGRLDTTNICQPAVTVITSISMDHMEYLGDTLEAIAGEKAGIIKPGAPVVFAADDPVCAAVIRKRAKELSAPLFPVSAKDHREELTAGRKLKVTVSWREGKREEPLSFLLPVPALYQGENAALALKALELLRDKRLETEAEENCGKITARLAAAGLEHTMWPARMEEILPGVYADGAHNPDGIRRFAETVNAMGKTSSLVFSASGDKEYAEMAQILCSKVRWKKIFIAHMENKRGAEAEALAEAFRSRAACPVEICRSVPEAFLRGIGERQKDEILFYAGSLYSAGEIKEAAEEYEHRHHQF